jgi:hypothetical protein
VELPPKSGAESALESCGFCTTDCLVFCLLGPNDVCITGSFDFCLLGLCGVCTDVNICSLGTSGFYTTGPKDILTSFLVVVTGGGAGLESIDSARSARVKIFLDVCCRGSCGLESIDSAEAAGARFFQRKEFRFSESVLLRFAGSSSSLAMAKVLNDDRGGGDALDSKSEGWTLLLGTKCPHPRPNSGRRYSHVDSAKSYSAQCSST